MTPPLCQVEAAAAWGVAFRLADAPSDVVSLSKSQIANILAAIIAGSRSGPGQRIRAAAARTAQAGPCTTVPHGDDASLWDALHLHATYANALELDDFHFRGHLGPAAVVVPLTLGEFLRASGADVLRAQVVANELGGRLGWAITAEVRHGHQRSYLLKFAAAAAAGVLLGLDERRFAMALAIAMTQPEMALHPGMFSPETKVLSAASSVVEGVRSAFLAEAGVTAALDILENPAGFYRQFTMHQSVESPFVQFGEAWCTHALSFKRYSACAYASGSVDAALAVRADSGFDPEAIQSIEVASSLPALIMERLARPHEPGQLTAINIQFSILRSVAAALCLGDLRGYHFQPAALEPLIPRIRRLEARSRLTHDWSFTLHQLRGIEDGQPEEGGTRSADLLQFYRTSSSFRRMFGSARAIGLADLGRLLALPPADRRFFLGRWQRSIRSHLTRGGPSPGRQVGDLRRLSWRMGGRVTVRLAGGRTLTAEQIIPTGMAGDPAREAMVRAKLEVETRAAVGDDRATDLWTAIATLDSAPVMDLPRIASTPREHAHAPTG